VSQEDPDRPARQRAIAAALGACLTVACTGAVVVQAHADVIAGARLGMALAGVLGVLSGLAVGVFSALRRHQGSRSERPRLLLGSALVVWGAGQVLLSAQLTSTGERTFGTGDVVSTCSLPVLLAALLTMPRHSRTSRPAVRLALDALMVTTSFTLALWWTWLQPALPDPLHPASGAVTGVAAAAFDVGFASFTLMVWARDRRRGSSAVAAGAVLQAVADIWSLPAVVGGHPLPWEPGAIWCVALPLLGAGIIQYATTPVTHEVSELEDVGESRATMISTVLSILVLAVAAGVARPSQSTPVGLTLAVATLLLFVAREVLNGLIRNRMAHLLGSEARRDVLTGLPNRSAMTARIRSLDLSRPWVLLTVDLDSFKEVNDLLGPEAGDELIGMAGGVLRRHTPPAAMVARMGGDEFGVLAPGTVEEGEWLAERLAQALRCAAAERGGGGVALTASIGVGRVRPDRAEEETASSGHDRLTALVESAAALRAAKAAGRDTIALYPGAVEQARRRRLVLERRLQAALRAGTLDMFAQPLVDLRTGRVVAFESLARWTDEELGPVSPAEFVPVAEQTGLVSDLGEFALRSTLLQARAGGLLGTDVGIAVNVSPIQLRDPRFAPMAVELVEELRMSPGQLMLEVTEAILIDEDDPASGSLARLAEAGIQLGIDDFGTGYSALGYLRRIPMDELKIDRSWVVASTTDQRTRDIVRGVVSLAHTLGATVVMEGIEDEATAQMCRDVDADLGQGWLFGKPMPWPVAAAQLTSAASAAAPTDGAVVA
jgi:diguanylate cyclase